MTDVSASSTSMLSWTGSLATPHRVHFSWDVASHQRALALSRRLAVVVAAPQAELPERPGGPPMPSTPLGVKRPGGGSDILVELFLDLCCPFSKKLFETVANNVAPHYEGTVSFVVHSVVQPWHAQSSYMHEASLAVLDMSGPAAFWKFLRHVFARQEEFFDDAVYEMSRRDIYALLADVAHAAEIVAEPSALLSRLELTGPGNAGNSATQRLKWATKLHRTRGVHVTPTVYVNSLEAGIVGSGWTDKEWFNFLDYHLFQAAVDAVGQPAMEVLRRDAESLLGGDFDLRVFHKIVLDAGPVPLDVLSQRVREWVAARARAIADI